MILEFSNLEEIEEEQSKIENTKLRKQKELEYFLTIKRNIIDLFLVHNDLLTDGQILQKSNSEPNLTKIKKHIINKISNKKKNEIKYKNLNIDEEESKIIGESKIKKIKNINNNIIKKIILNVTFILIIIVKIMKILKNLIMIEKVIIYKIKKI